MKGRLIMSNKIKLPIIFLSLLISSSLYTSLDYFREEKFYIKVNIFLAFLFMAFMFILVRLFFETILLYLSVQNCKIQISLLDIITLIIHKLFVMSSIYSLGCIVHIIFINKPNIYYSTFINIAAFTMYYLVICCEVFKKTNSKKPFFSFGIYNMIFIIMQIYNIIKLKG